MKIISGGQTGADRAGLDVAIALGLEYGGALPKGRKTEDGPLDLKYKSMTELSTDNYPARTEKNVKDSDGTLMFVDGKIGKGTALTIKICEKLHKPYLIIDFQDKKKDHVKNIAKWLKILKPRALNIAGPRESGELGIYEKTCKTLREALKMI
ncbi:MAG: putative molybdenum carrier protein [Elusimicrobia bacterium]|nr:putative molybdenum carrier protein [Candidatus Liberimonas magnetica]